MNKYKVLILSLLPFFSLFSHAQCGMDAYHEQNLAPYLNSGQTLSDYVRKIENEENKNTTGSRTSNKNGLRTIPVVFHVIHTYGTDNISKEQIENQLRIVNEDFQRLNKDTSKTRAVFKGVAADLNIEFVLAKKAQDGSAFEGINRIYSPLTFNARDNIKSLIKWDQARYLNIWVVNTIKNENDESLGTILGYGFFPWMENPGQLDGIVIRHDRVGTLGTANSSDAGRTLTHEIGHWLGLFHPFQGGCSGGDAVDDTPPVANPSYGCPTTNNTCSNDFPNLLDQIENYMDYANGTCMNMFTKGQKTRVDVFMQNSTTYRGRNITAANLIATGANTNPATKPIADFYTADPKSQSTCVGSPMVMKNWTYNTDLTKVTYLWTFEGGTPATSTLANPSVTYASPGIYKVTLKATNAQGVSEVVKDKFITVRPSDGTYKAPFLERFGTPISVQNWDISNPLPDFGWRHSTAIGRQGIGCMFAEINESTPANGYYSLVSDGIDLSKASSTGNKMLFDLAYAKAANNANSSDILLVEASVNCKETFEIIKTFTESTGIVTSTDIQGNWKPTKDEHWKNIELNLDKYAGKSSLFLRFSIVSRSGNNLYIDNLNVIKGINSVNSVTLQGVSIFPNPATNKINITLPTAQKHAIEIIDILGKILYQDVTQRTNNVVDLPNVQAGIYFVNIKNIETAATFKQKIVVE